MDEQKEKQNAKKKRSALPIYAIGIVWLLYASKLNTFRGILSCAVVSAIVYASCASCCPAKRRTSRRSCRAGAAPAEAGGKEA